MSTTVDHSMESSTPIQSPPAPRPKNTFVEFAQMILLVAIIVVPIRLFVASPFVVSGASMDHTFQDGQYVIVEQLSYQFNDPSRGDVVIFRYPEDDRMFFIKRVIGLPGDTVTITGTTVTITNDEHPDGFTIDEPYIAGMRPVTQLSHTLGDEEYFVMGDNRDHSSDSRAWGAVPEENIVGRAWLRLLPIQTATLLPGATEYDQTTL